jgi:hypothetical protein
VYCDISSVLWALCCVAVYCNCANTNETKYWLACRTETLLEGASAFRTGARRVQRKMWWQNVRLKVLIGLVALLLVLVVGGV